MAQPKNAVRVHGEEGDGRGRNGDEYSTRTCARARSLARARVYICVYENRDETLVPRENYLWCLIETRFRGNVV